MGNNGSRTRKHRRRKGRTDRRQRQVPVTRDGSVISFTDATSAELRHAIREINGAVADGQGEICLDFRRSRRAFASCMLPLVTCLESLRVQGCATSIVLPDNHDLRHLFHNANWAHLLDPASFAPFTVSFDRHLAARRFTDLKEQQAVVSAFVDVVTRSMILPRDALRGLEWSINEITDNVMNHSEAENGGIAQVTTVTSPRMIHFTVVDGGRGIPASMSEGYPDLRDDAHAIEEAVKAGVTRNKEVGQGNGLAGTLRIASLSGGSLEVTSGRASLSVHPDFDRAAKTYQRSQLGSFRGTVVAASIGPSKFSMEDALGFTGSTSIYDYIEANYENDAGTAHVLRIKAETTGTGTRKGGRAIRMKCLNLLGADLEKPLVIDWAELPVISSSFADEAIGKLFVKLGPMTFAARVRNINMEALVRGLVDKAISQRVAQTQTKEALEHIDDEEPEDSELLA